MPCQTGVLECHGLAMYIDNPFQKPCCGTILVPSPFLCDCCGPSCVYAHAPAVPDTLTPVLLELACVAAALCSMLYCKTDHGASQIYITASLASCSKNNAYRAAPGGNMIQCLAAGSSLIVMQVEGLCSMVSGVEELLAKAERQCTAMQVVPLLQAQ